MVVISKTYEPYSRDGSKYPFFVNARILILNENCRSCVKKKILRTAGDHFIMKNTITAPDKNTRQWL